MTVFLASCFLSAPLAWAGWSTDPAVDIPVETVVAGAAYAQRPVHDGAGGYFVVWYDDRSGNDDIYAQYFDKAGDPQWAADGIAVCAVVNDQNSPKAVSQDGYLFVSWADNRSGTGNDIYVQKYDKAGDALWTADGVLTIGTASGDGCAWMAPDGAGGVFVVSRTSYINRLDGNGNLLLGAADSVPQISAAGQYARIVSDGAGGVIATFTDGSSDLVIQRVDGSGTSLWNSGTPVLVASSASSPSCPRLISDGAGGAVVVWFDTRAPAGYVPYAQRYDSSGTALWTAGGVQVTTMAADWNYVTCCASDTAGGVFVTWIGGSDDNVYAQRVLANGSLDWGGDLRLTTNGNWYGWSYPPDKTVPDGSGGFITAWSEYDVSDGYSVKAQRVDADGNELWTATGEVICSESIGTKDCLRIATNGQGGIVAAWQDDRANDDIYMQGVTRDGAVGEPVFALPPEGCGGAGGCGPLGGASIVLVLAAGGLILRRKKR